MIKIDLTDEENFTPSEIWNSYWIKFGGKYIDFISNSIINDATFLNNRYNFADATMFERHD